MDYNELKRALLKTLAEAGPLDSMTLLEKLNLNQRVQIEIHALRMALVRYYRQGLLRRVRAGGQFTYALSDRGHARLQWLEGQSGDSDSAHV